MYIAELLYLTVKRLILARKKGAPEQVPAQEECRHVFLPIDSTKEILACSKCGKVVRRRDFYGKNFFENGKDENTGNAEGS